jgi:hypothetical protein
VHTQRRDTASCSWKVPQDVCVPRTRKKKGLCFCFEDISVTNSRSVAAPKPLSRQAPLPSPRFQFNKKKKKVVIYNVVGRIYQVPSNCKKLYSTVGRI